MQETLKIGRKKFLAKGVIACKKSWRNWKQSSLKSIAALNEEVDELNFLLQDCEPRSQMPTGNIFACKSSTVCAFFITNWTSCTYLPHSSCFSLRCKVSTTLTAAAQVVATLHWPYPACTGMTVMKHKNRFALLLAIVCAYQSTWPVIFWIHHLNILYWPT